MEKTVTDGIYAKEEVLSGIEDAAKKIDAEIRTGSLPSAGIVWCPSLRSTIFMGSIQMLGSSGLMPIRMFLP
ncbi:MAG TPA: hypothetical protein H9700_03130 [Candidatus Eisenbergiella intestinipullorum]|nr:hypothetical protein [Candidatus Eisenbergiella intestinipullorum]